MKQWIFSQYLKQRYKKLLDSQVNPARSQDKAFRRLQKQLKLTQYKNYNDYLKNQPVVKYSDLEPRIDADIESGAKSDVEFIGLSSGTTGQKSKQIPFNLALAKLYKKYQLTAGAILQKETNLQLLKDQRVTWGTSPVVDYSPQGVPRGYISGYMSMKSPAITRKLSFPSTKSHLIFDMEEKSEALMEETMNLDIKYFGGVPTYLINLFETILKKNNVKTLVEIWPNISAVFYAATPIAPYKDKLNELAGKELKYLGVYLATEGPYGWEVPELNGGVNGIYSLNLEDLVIGFRREGKAEILNVSEVQIGDEVELVISTPNEFINYATGDLVRIVSSKPLLVEILGRIGQGVNVAAEKTTMHQLHKTIQATAEATNTTLEHFFVFPSFSAKGRPCYEWVIATNDDVPAHELQLALDASLGEFNYDYNDARKISYRLDVPTVQTIPAEFVQTYFKVKSQRGQLKMKHVFTTKAEFAAFKAEIEGLVERISA